MIKYVPKFSTHSEPTRSQRMRNSFRSNHSEFLLSVTRTAVTVSVCGTISRCNLGLGSNSFNAVSCTRGGGAFSSINKYDKSHANERRYHFRLRVPEVSKRSKVTKWVLENLHLLRLARANGPQDRVVRLRCGRIRCKSAQLSFSHALLSLSCSNYD